jgi:hypothetical protein
MRVYIIGNDGIRLCQEAPATVNDGEVAVASKEELHAAPLIAKRLLALWNALPGVEKRRKVGDRAALIDQLWSAIEALPNPEPRSDAKRPSKQDEVIAMLRRPEGATADEVASATGWQRHTVRGVFSGTLEEARAYPCLGKRGTRPRLPRRRIGKRMKLAIYDASARPRAGEPSPVRQRDGNRHNRPRRPEISEVERQIAGLVNRSTPDLRVAWRQLYHTGPPWGLSRDLLIRALAYLLQEQSYGGMSRALRRRLQSVAGASDKATMTGLCSLPARPCCVSGADTRTLSSSTKTDSSTRASSIGR